MSDNKNKTTDYDVIIVGAGPAGLSLSIQLAKHGVRFQIIDKKSSYIEKSNAFALQSSTLHAFNQLGLADGLIQLGAQVRKVNAYIKGEPSFDIDFRKEIPTPFPYLLSLEQAKLEKVLYGFLLNMGHQVHWNAELTSFKQTKKGVSVEIVQEGKKIHTSTSWLVGCDGTESSVREILNMPYQGNQVSEKFILADLAIEWGLNKNEGYAFLHPSDLFVVVPLGDGLYRVMTTQEGVVDRQNITVDDLVKKFKRLVPVPGVLTTPKWLQGFEVQRRNVPQMRVGRVFLAGDAAHTHSPIGGQGLNCGIQDALNLGWKLAYNVKGWVEDQYLDSYDQERLPVAKATFANTNLAMNIVMTHSKIGQIIRDIIAPLILNYPAAQKQLKRIIADTPVKYNNSSVMLTDKEASQNIARKIKDSVLGGVSIGDCTPSFELLKPKDFKRFQFLKLQQTTKHILFVMQGDQSKDFKENYENFSCLKKNLQDFADCYYIVGEHAIDYTTFDQNLTDVFIDPDGRAHQAFNCSEQTLFLSRPDGYISYKGPANLQSLKDFLKAHFNLDHFKNVDPVNLAV